MVRSSKTKSIELLNTALNAIPKLKSMLGSPEFDKWQEKHTCDYQQNFC